IYGDALEFYRGEWSPRAIYERTHTPGFPHFPGEGHLAVAWAYYRTAGELVLGTAVFWIGAVGLIAAALTALDPPPEARPLKAKLH
ncbi:hypothetical protein B4Q13_21860, partial [Lacticaseibacillus rhamnosus]